MKCTLCDKKLVQLHKYGEYDEFTCHNCGRDKILITSREGSNFLEEAYLPFKHKEDLFKIYYCERDVKDEGCLIDIEIWNKRLFIFEYQYDMNFGVSEKWKLTRDNYYEVGYKMFKGIISLRIFES